MKNYSIGTRYIALLLLVALFFSFVPSLGLYAHAAETNVDKLNLLSYKTADEDGITMLNNGNSVSLPIKINNFVNDGLLFEFLGNIDKTLNNPNKYRWEHSKNDGKAFVQLFPYALINQYGKKNAMGTEDADGNFILFDTDGISNTIKPDATLADAYGNRYVLDPLKRNVNVNYHDDTANYETWDENAFPYLRLTYAGSEDRGWTKLTTFNDKQNIRNIRYAVVVYRVNTGSQYYRDDFYMTVNYKTDTVKNKSQVVKRVKGKVGLWQFAVIDLLGGDASVSTSVSEVYLHTFLDKNSIKLEGDVTTPAMDIAAVGYFPYYGDAEQFGYYGVSMGCDLNYFKRFDEDDKNINTHNGFGFDLPSYIYGEPLQSAIGTSQGVAKVDGDVSNAKDTIGYELKGLISGDEIPVGLLEPALVNGRPVYKDKVVEYVANLMRWALTDVPEYPDGSNGWRNPVFVSGSTTTSGSCEALFGRDTYDRPMDLATALCKQIGVDKDTDGPLGEMAIYDEDGKLVSGTKAKADKLIGSWNACKGNIETWTDAAYYLLHNLYVTDNEVADPEIDAYGEYEDDYQYLVLPQVKWNNNGKAVDAYFFDSGYAHLDTFNRDTDKIDVDNMTGAEFTSAITYDKKKHTITLDGDANIKPFCYTRSDGSGTANVFPFLPTSGTGTQSGESNVPHWNQTMVDKRNTRGRAYHTKDFHYSMTGNGFFYYAPGLYFNFEGDDDVYLFINGQLVVDVGGSHGAVQYNMNLDDYVNWANEQKKTEAYELALDGNFEKMDKTTFDRVNALALETGKRYSFDFFYMERHGVGANLRILTNIQVGESGLPVDKFAYQEDEEIPDNGLFDTTKKVEYGFSITNNTEGKLYNLVFEDKQLGITLDPSSGLTASDKLSSEYNTKLLPNSLKITVTGIKPVMDDKGKPELDENGKVKTKDVKIHVTCKDQTELINFLKTLDSDDGTDINTSTEIPDNETENDKFIRLHSGNGLWVDATVTIRGIYTMVETTNKFTNTVNVSAISNGTIVTGFAKHTLYNAGSMVDYYQWAGHPIVITRDKLRADLIAADIAKDSDLPDVRDMVLLPADSSVSNVPGGNVYLKVNYDDVGAYVTYVTILSKADEEFTMTVPLVVYALDGQDSIVVLDYGLDTNLTENSLIFDFGTAAGKVDGKVLGIAPDGSSAEYIEFADGMFNKNHTEQYAGTAHNELNMIMGSGEQNGKHNQVVYALDKPIQLKHNKPWVIQWKGIVPDTRDVLFALYDNANTEGNITFQIRNLDSTDKRYMGFGYRTQTGWDGTDKVEYITMGLGGTNSLTGPNKKVHDVLKDSLDNNTAYKFELRNEMNMDGTNSIHLFINDQKVGTLDQFFVGDSIGPTETDAQKAEAQKFKDWFSGRDFVFNYIGAVEDENNHALSGTYDYFRVYENGMQFQNYNWQMTKKEDGGYEFTNTSADKNGYTVATPTLISGQIDQTNGKLYIEEEGNKLATCWQLDTSMLLNHDRPWTINFEAALHDGSNIVMSQSNDTKFIGHAALIVRADTNVVGIGIRAEDGYTLYGVKVDNINLKENHKYELRNEFGPDGRNMVYLYLDNVKVGALDSMYKGETLLSETSHGISGNDFIFTFIGHSYTALGFHSGATLSSMSVCYSTGMDTAYEWKYDNTDKKLKSNNGIEENGADQTISVKDQQGTTTEVSTKGNQIVFVKEEDNVIDFQNGDFTYTYKLEDNGTLKFQMKNFLENGYTVKAAISIFKKDFTPSALDADIDIGNEAQMFKKVTVVPASVVYYEDDFPAIHYAGTDVTKNGFTTVTDNTVYIKEGTGSSSLTQSPAQDTPYGSDPTYSGDNGDYSGKTMHKIAINNDGPLVWFTFTGTGFEISSRTNAFDSGMLLVDVYKAEGATIDANGVVSDGTIVTTIPVVSEFDNMASVDKGNEGGTEAIYQVPLIRYNSNVKDTYLVVISGIEMFTDFEVNEDGNIVGGNPTPTYLYLDGIRIYQPSDGDNNLSYGNEINTSFEEVRNLILEGNMLACNFSGKVTDGQFTIGSATTTWTEKRNSRDYTNNRYTGNVVNSVNDYLIEGPNNEVYMVGGTDINKNQNYNGALVFYVNESSARNDGLLHIGVRAIDMGLFYGMEATGLSATLHLGVATADGLGWHELATVISGTEQYINVPYQLCPVVVSRSGVKYYQVVIRVPATYGDKVINENAMVSFSGLKTTNGLMLGRPEKAFFEAADKTLVQSTSDTESDSTHDTLRSVGLQFFSEKVVDLMDIEAGSEYILNALDEDNGSQVPTEKFELAGANTVLGSLLDMNFFINPSDLNGTDYYAEIKLYTENGTQTTTVPYADWEVRTNYLVVTQKGLAARQMADKIEVVIYKADGTQVSNVWTDSIRDYAMRILEDQNDECKTLIVDMLNYGATAQVEFGYNTDDLANNLLSETQKGYATENVSCTDQLVQGESYFGSTLTLKDRIILNVYFSDITPDMYAVVTFTDHNGNAHKTRVEGSTFSKYNSNVYGVAVNELVVADGDQLVTVTVYDANGNEVASASDTINSYVARQMDDGVIYEMIAKFTTSAYAYFH